MIYPQTGKDMESPEQTTQTTQLVFRG